MVGSAKCSLVLMFVFASMPRNSMACSCLERPLREIYAEATLVFRGELVKARPHPTDRCGDETLTFVPNKIWKGESRSRYVIRNGSIGRHPDGSLPGPVFRFS
jgi:hypothetical protein